MKIALFIGLAAWLFAGLVMALSMRLPPRFLVSRWQLIIAYMLIIATWPFFYALGVFDLLRGKWRIRQARKSGRLRNGEI